MVTQHFQEVYLQKSHINSKILISLAASIIINGAAFAIFLPSIRFYTAPAKTVYDISIVDLNKSQRKIKHKKNLLNFAKEKNHYKPEKISSKVILQPKLKLSFKQKKQINRTITKKTISLKKAKFHKTRYQTKPHRPFLIPERVVATKPTNLSNNKSPKIFNSTLSRTLKPKKQNIQQITISSSSNQKLYSWIASHRFYPLEAIFNNEEGEVKLIFYIDKKGNIYRIQFKQRSFKDLNRAAVEILKKSSPIPSEILTSLSRQPPLKASLILKFKLEN